jgi:VanZ family protein
MGRKLSIVLTILLAIEIFYFSSISAPALGPQKYSIVPIAYHFIAFFLFSFFLFDSIKGIKLELFEKIILILTTSSFYAVTDEIHQIFIPFRSCTFFDFLVDFTGICSAIILCLLIEKNKKQDLS